MSRARAVPQDLRPDARSRDADAQSASPPVAVPPQPDALLALQASIGNHAVARLLMREPAATEAPAGGGEVRVVERLPTIPEPGVEYIVQPPEKRYDFEVTIHEKPMRFRELTPEQTIAKLRAVWRLCHDDLDTGRAENERLVKRRADHWVAAFWSDTLGGVEVPDPDMWNEVGRGPLYEVVQVLNATEETLRAKWERGEASIDRGLGPGLENNPYMQEALAFDATRERIKSATEKLEKAAAELRERQRRLDAYVEGSIRGAQRAISGIKVTIVVLGAGAGGAGASFARGAGYLGQAAASAGTTGFLGSTEEFFTQVGEMRIGEREDWDFDFGKIAKRGTKDVVNGFVGGVIGGKFSQVLKGRIGGWASGLSDEVLTAHGITREQLVTNGEKLFIDWVAGSVASSPFTTASGVLMDRALEGKWKVKNFDEFTGLVFDDMVQSGAMGGFLTYGGHAMSGTPSITSGGDGGGGGGGGRGGGGGGGGEPSRPLAGEGPISSGVPEPIPAAETSVPVAGEGPPSSGVPEPIPGTEATRPVAGEGPISDGVPEPVPGTETTQPARPASAPTPEAGQAPPAPAEATAGEARADAPRLPPDFEAPADLEFTKEGPMVRIPIGDDSPHAPADPVRVLEISAGPRDTNLGLPVEPNQGDLAVHDPNLVDITRTDIQPRPGVIQVDATRPIPPELHGQDAVIVNNPRGYRVDIATIGEAVRPGGSIIIQGRAEVREGMRGINPDMNRVLTAVVAGDLPPGFRVVEVVTLPDVPSGPPDLNPKPADIMGGPFNRTSGEGPVSWPNTRIIIRRIDPDRPEPPTPELPEPEPS